MIKVGEVVDGKYSVTRVLGQGGMGMVVEAYRDTLDQHVAIKFMRSDMVAASGGAERFLREAQALVKLKSQHAVKVYDMGVHRRMPYIVMEHLEGMDMQMVLDKHGPMPPADAARHVRQACEAIEEAHSHGIYHRDLKPANLFLAVGAGGRIIVKVLDFGIAKMMRTPEDKASLKNSLTGMHILIGTLPYMSPEQLLSPKDIDARADLWSLGVVLYELVTGELPFRGQDMYEVQQAIRNDSPKMAGFPPSLAPIVRRCLQKNPADRYASAKDLAIALRPVVNESLSPFGVPSVRFQEVAPKGGKAAGTVRLAPSDVAANLAKDLLAATEREPKASPVEIREMHPLLHGGPDSDDDMTARAVSPVVPDSDEDMTLRMVSPVAAPDTVRMGAERASPATIRQVPPARASSPSNITLMSSAAPEPPAAATRTPIKPIVVGFEHRVEPVRRGVLVVKEPIKLSRRQRGTSRRGLLVVAAGMACVMGFGLAWTASQHAERAQSFSATPATDSPILDGEQGNDDSSLDSSPHSRPLPALPND